MAGVGRKISAASARAHTRKSKQKSSFKLPPGMFKTVLLIALVGFVAWAYQAIQPPPAKLCGSPGGPPVTAPRIKLKDGRHLAYKEHGVPIDKANYKVVLVHGFGCCRLDFSYIPQQFAEEQGVYLMSFDRAGYGESDANPNRVLNSTALDIEQLADQLGLGSKFYVAGYSMGGQVIWTCLKYIPHRLLGAALLTPVVNYWWPGFPANLSKQVYNEQLAPDQWAVRVAHYTPWLIYWWNTQKWFPSSAVAAQRSEIFSEPDKAILPRFLSRTHTIRVNMVRLLKTARKSSAALDARCANIKKEPMWFSDDSEEYIPLQHPARSDDPYDVICDYCGTLLTPGTPEYSPAQGESDSPHYSPRSVTPDSPVYTPQTPPSERIPNEDTSSEPEEDEVPEPWRLQSHDDEEDNIAEEPEIAQTPEVEPAVEDDPDCFITLYWTPRKKQRISSI